MATISSKSFEVVNEKTNKSKGPLVTVEIAPGRHAKMYQADAEKAGLIEPAKKSAPAGGNKMRPPASDKMKPPAGDKGSTEQTEQEPAAPPEPADDFTAIDGVGPATARALAAAGIVTFEQLKTAAAGDGLSKVVSGSVQAAIEEWMSNG